MRGIYSLFLFLFFRKTLSINKNDLILRKKVKTMYNKIKTCAVKNEEEAMDAKNTTP